MLLNKDQVERYGRQLITPGIGVQGQSKLVNAKVLIVGAGGLGCPIAMYLASAGVGTIGVVDYDTVEISNLHRQIAHNESRVGISKAESLVQTMTLINSTIKGVAHHDTFTSDTAMQLVEQYDVVVDASDNVATRYLVNDCCVLSHKPLVSGSALKWEGQVTVYNFNNGPCYRCIFPRPPPPETVTRCSDGGVLGPIVGVIGSLQALEVIKLICSTTKEEEEKEKELNNNQKVEGETMDKSNILSGKLLLYDGLMASFKTVRIRSRQSNCAVCGDNPTIDKLIDYPQFCHSPYSESAGKVEDRIDKNLIITCKQYQEIKELSIPHLLLDVRPTIQYNICSLPNSLNIPIDELKKQNNLDKIESIINKENVQESLPIYIICRRGNKSQDATQILKEKLKNSNSLSIQHIKDGFLGWSQDIDNNFPIY